MTAAATLDVLRRARQRITDPAHWQQGAYRDHTALPNDDCAVCAVGALRWAAWGGNIHGYDVIRLEQTDIFFDAYNVMKRHANSYTSVAMWNDVPGRTHDEVLAAFDAAIENAEAAL